MSEGYIKLDRSLLNHWLWEEKPFDKARAWVDLLLLANHKTTKGVYKDEIVEYKRGTVNRSITWLADRWGWSRDKTRRFLRVLESDGMVRVEPTPNRTVVTIENYASFQDRRTANKAANKATNRQRADTYNNDNNDKNNNNPPNPPTGDGMKLGVDV